MASPSNRQQLIDYCLRSLGQPVLEINVDDDQLEDRVDEAFQFYREYHYDAIEMVYLSEKINPSVLTISGTNAASFNNGEKITGGSSGATAIIYSNRSSSSMNVKKVTGTFSVGETITGDVTATTASVATITLGNYDNRYLTTTDSVVGVNRVLPFSSRNRGIDLFDVRYQILLNDLYSLQSTDLIYYSQVKTQLQLIQDILVGIKPVRFNRHQNRLYIDMSWEDDVEIGDYIIVEGYKILDPDTYTDVYNDYFLKTYATALIKRQWGNNLKKFEGVQLPGGVTLNGQKIFDEATEELKELKLEIQNTYQLPIDFFTG
jgi:hypothetical protein